MKTQLLALLALISIITATVSRAETIGELTLTSGGELTVTDKIHFSNVEASGAGKNRAATFSQIITLFGSNLTITSAGITDGTLLNADVNASAAIAGTKIAGDDTAYDATSWNGSTAVASKNAIRDKIETLGGGASGWTLKTADYTAVSGDRLVADTTPAAFTITLPASPSAGDTVEIVDKSTTWRTEDALSIARNGQSINGVAADSSLATPAHVLFVFSAGYGWQVFIAPSGGDRITNGEDGAQTLVATTSGLIVADGANLHFGETTGTIIGGGSNQKLSFWGSSPITRPVALTAANEAHSMSGFETVDLNALNAALNALGARVNELETLLESVGLVTPN